MKYDFGPLAAIMRKVAETPYFRIPESHYQGFCFSVHPDRFPQIHRNACPPIAESKCAECSGYGDIIGDNCDECGGSGTRPYKPLTNG